MISAFNSLTLSPALAALLLRPRVKGVFQALPWPAFVAAGGWMGYAFLGIYVERLARIAGLHLENPWLSVETAASLAGLSVGALVGFVLSRVLNRFFGWTFYLFNKAFDASTTLYSKVVSGLLRVSVLVLLLYAGLLGLTYWTFMRTPTGFHPRPGQGIPAGQRAASRLFVAGAHPEGDGERRAAGEQTRGRLAHDGDRRSIDSHERQCAQLRRDVRDARRVSPPRQHRGLSGPKIAAELQSKLEDEISDGLVNVFDAPPVDGLGTAGGFKIVVQDRGDLGSNEIETTADRIVEDSRSAANSHMLTGLFTSFRANTPWLYLDINRDKAKLAGVSISELFNTLQVYLGSLYINDFNRFGRTWQVNVQGEANFRKQMSDLAGLRVRNLRGGMVPLGSIAKIRDVSGPVMLIRYNLYPSATINLNAAPGVSSGQALDAMERLVELASTAGHAIRMDRAGPLAAADRIDGDVRLHAGRRAGVPGAGGPVRKLVAAAGRDPGRADVPALLDRRREHRADGYQHLHPGRIHRAGGPGVQERDL